MRHSRIALRMALAHKAADVVSKMHSRLRIFLRESQNTDGVADFAYAHVREFERLAVALYDEVWPQWIEAGEVQLSWQFLDEDDMRMVNARYRNVDRPTDVLTFPMFEQDGQFIPDMTQSPLLLGDVLFCLPVIRRNACEHGVTALSELALVAFHGMLHLLAWDHDTPEREARMWKVQERYRDLFLSSVVADLDGV